MILQYKIEYVLFFVKKNDENYYFENHTHLYQFWKNHKGTPLDFIQKMIQNLISYGKIDISVIFTKRDVAGWNRIFYVFSKKKMKIDGPVVGVARGRILQELSINLYGSQVKG